MRKINTAIIGFGVFGKQRYECIKKNKNYKISYIVDKSFKLKKNKIKNICFYQNLDDFLKESNEIDAVFLCLPNYLSSKITKIFLKKNIHVFCEKPPARNLKEIKDVKKILKNKKVILKYGFNHRHHNSIKVAKKIIDSKRYGEIINFRGVYGKSMLMTNKIGNWRVDKRKSGGGILLDQGIHILDLIFYLSKTTFKKSYSYISNNYWKYSVEDNAYVVLKNNKNQIAMVHSTATSWSHKFSLDITLEKALIELKGIITNSRSYGKETIILTIKSKNSINGSKNIKLTKFKKDNSLETEVNDFSICIKKNKKVQDGNINECIKLMILLQSIYN